MYIIIINGAQCRSLQKVVLLKYLKALNDIYINGFCAPILEA